MDLLRFITAGSVDDGKSTLIGRLLYDSKSILADQLEALEKISRNKKAGEIDLALLTDGLRAEREQGITIDVAYRYFATPKRKFIIADAPGHVQYTRNMITGASNASLMIILIDARQGVVEQTRRHAIIAALLRIPQIVVAINKMDLVGYSQDRFNTIALEFGEAAQRLKLGQISFIPVSALEGDNIVTASAKMTWYEGQPLLQYLETVDAQPKQSIAEEEARLQVQYVIRPQTNALPDYRGFAGKLSSGVFRTGDVVSILPSGKTSSIRKLEVAGKPVDLAFAPQPLVIQLADAIDISRGDSILPEKNTVRVSREANALICWLDEKPLTPGNKYLLQQQSRQLKVQVRDILYKLDVNSLEQEQTNQPVRLNEVARVLLKAAAPLVYDSFDQLASNGTAILIDETTHATVAAVLFQ